MGRAVRLREQVVLLLRCFLVREISKRVGSSKLLCGRVALFTGSPIHLIDPLVDIKVIAHLRRRFATSHAIRVVDVL